MQPGSGCLAEPDLKLGSHVFTSGETFKLS